MVEHCERCAARSASVRRLAGLSSKVSELRRRLEQGSLSDLPELARPLAELLELEGLTSEAPRSLMEAARVLVALGGRDLWEQVSELQAEAAKLDACAGCGQAFGVGVPLAFDGEGRLAHLECPSA